MRNHGQEAYNFLEKLSFPRVSGSDAELRAADMIAEQVRQLGFTPVVEAFQVCQNRPVHAEFQMTAPEQVSYTVTGMINAGETALEGVEAPFYYIRTIDEITLPNVKGKIVLLNGRPSEKDYKRLVEAGMVAMMQMCGTTRDTEETIDLDTMRFRDMFVPYGKVPAFAIRMTDALDLLKRKVEKVHFSLQLENVEKTSHNVIVEVPGTTKADEVIVVGAHYDSTEFSCGAWDNGGGVVQLLELLAHFQDHRPARTVRVIFFGSEEVGLKGSHAYVEMHEAELANIRYMINTDVGGSYLGQEMLVSTAVADAESYLYGLMCESQYSARLGTSIMSSDGITFADYGIPTVSMGQFPTQGSSYMHTRYDNFARISADVLAEEIRFLIFLTERMANVAVFPIARVIPKDLRSKIIGYFGAAQSHTAKQTEFPAEPEPRRSMI